MANILAKDFVLVWRCLLQFHDGLTPAQVAAKTPELGDTDKARDGNARRCLASLVYEGFVYFDTEDNRYRANEIWTEL